MWRLLEPGSFPDAPEDLLVDVDVVVVLEPLAPAPAPLVVVVPATLAEGEEEPPQALRTSALRPATRAARIGDRLVRSRAT